MARVNQRVSNRVCVVNGVRMSVPERNILMKLDFINGGLTLKAISEKYGLSYETVSQISSANKWSREKKAQQQKIKDAYDKQIVQVYAGCAVDITLQHNNTWQKIINIVNDILNDPETYLISSTTGQYKVGVLEMLAGILEKCQAGQNLSSGFVSKLEAMRFELSRQQLELRKRMAGEDDEDVVEDNFIEAVEKAAKDVNLWGDDSNES